MHVGSEANDGINENVEHFGSFPVKKCKLSNGQSLALANAGISSTRDDFLLISNRALQRPTLAQSQYRYEVEALLIECKPGTGKREGMVGSLECAIECGKTYSTLTLSRHTQ